MERYVKAALAALTLAAVTTIGIKVNKIFTALATSQSEREHLQEQLTKLEQALLNQENAATANMKTLTARILGLEEENTEQRAALQQTRGEITSLTAAKSALENTLAETQHQVEAMKEQAIRREGQLVHVIRTLEAKLTATTGELSDVSSQLKAKAKAEEVILLNNAKLVEDMATTQRELAEAHLTIEELKKAREPIPFYRQLLAGGASTQDLLGEVTRELGEASGGSDEAFSRLMMHQLMRTDLQNDNE